MRTVLSALSVCAVTVLFGQARNANWVFSDGMWMQFTDTSLAILPSPYSSAGRSSCISDTSGQFLLLVDDAGIRDAQFNLLPGASATELGWTNPRSSYLILPKPGVPTHYCILVNEMPPNARAGYVEIDLSVNGGAGGVASTGTIWYMQNITAKLIATTDADETGYWVVQHADSGNAFQTFHLTNQGLAPFPVVSHTGRSYLADTAVFLNADLYRPMKFSAQGDKLAAITLGNDPDSNALELFHFDRTNGLLYFWEHLTTALYYLDSTGQLIQVSAETNRFITDCEFSPDGQKLYYDAGDTGLFFGGCNLVQLELGDPVSSAIQESAFFVIGMGNYSSSGWDLTGTFILTGLNGLLYTRSVSYSGLGFIFEMYALPGITMDSLTGPLSNPLIDIIHLPNSPYASNVGNFPNICKRYVDSAPMTTAVSPHQKASSEVRAWPNPNGGCFMVQWNGAASTAQARITDATGRTLPGIWALHNGDNSIDIRHLADGAYVLELRSGDEVRRVRVVKQ